jgi:hypothetical protein
MLSTRQVDYFDRLSFEIPLIRPSCNQLQRNLRNLPKKGSVQLATSIVELRFNLASFRIQPINSLFFDNNHV